MLQLFAVFAFSSSLSRNELGSKGAHLFDHSAKSRADISDIKFANGTLEIVDVETVTKDNVAATLQSLGKNKEDVLKIILKGNVKTLDDNVFADYVNLTSIDANVSLSIIGSKAFFNCKKLNYAYFYPSYTKIGDSAFSNCKKLGKFFVAATVTEIGTYAFAYCDSLLTFDFDSRSILKTIPKGCFESCYSLNIFVCPGSLESIDDDSFANCISLAKFFINEGLKYLSPLALRNTVLFSDFMIFISNNLFTEEPKKVLLYNKTSVIKATNTLKGDITLPDTVDTVGAYSFQKTDISSIKIPKNVKKIDTSAFAGSKSLQAVEFEDGSLLIELGEDCFKDCEKLSSINFEALQSLTATQSGLFSGCKELQKLYFSSSVVSFAQNTCIGCEKLQTIEFHADKIEVADSAFSGCSSLTEVKYYGIGPVKGSNGFPGCPKLTKIEVTSKYQSDRFMEYPVDNVLDGPTESPDGSGNVTIIIAIVVSVAILGVIVGVSIFIFLKKSKRKDTVLLTEAEAEVGLMK